MHIKAKKENLKASDEEPNKMYFKNERTRRLNVSNLLCITIRQHELLTYNLSVILNLCVATSLGSLFVRLVSGVGKAV